MLKGRLQSRPFKDGKDVSYDVDVICEVQSLEKKDITPSKLMDIFEKAINDAGYHKYRRWEKCFTVEYAVINDCCRSSFKIY